MLFLLKSCQNDYKRWRDDISKSGFNFPCLALTLIQVVQCRNFLKQSLILQVTANSPASVPHGHTWSQISAAVNIARWACGVRTPSQLPQPKCTFWVKQRTCLADTHTHCRCHYFKKNLRIYQQLQYFFVVLKYWRSNLSLFCPTSRLWNSENLWRAD